MSEWIMPEWMREVWNAGGWEPEYFERGMRDNGINQIQVKLFTEKLRAAKLLSTPAEHDTLQKQLDEYKMAAAELDGELAAAGNREEKLQERVRELEEMLPAFEDANRKTLVENEDALKRIVMLEQENERLQTDNAEVWEEYHEFVLDLNKLLPRKTGISILKEVGKIVQALNAGGK